MFWYILIGVSALLVILGLVFIGIGNDEEGVLYWAGNVLASLFGLILIITSIVVPVVKVYDDREVSVFISQKEYFETVVPTLPDSDNYALTQKKIELNEWLYEAKYEKKHFAFFSLYSDKILELTEIR